MFTILKTFFKVWARYIVVYLYVCTYIVQQWWTYVCTVYCIHIQYTHITIQYIYSYFVPLLTYIYIYIYIYITLHHSICTKILSTKYIYTVHICTLYNNCSEYICFNHGALSNEIKFDKHRKKDLEMVKNITT